MQICDFANCDFRYTGDPAYNVHVRTTHRSHNPPHKRVCKICTTPRCFSHKRDLNRHINSEHKLIRHACSSCPASYKRKDLLLRHCINKHRSQQQQIPVPTPCCPQTTPPRCDDSESDDDPVFARLLNSLPVSEIGLEACLAICDSAADPFRFRD